MAPEKTLDTKTVDQITQKLSKFLADTFVLYVKTLNFHWNMIGEEFFMYHRLLEEQYKELADALDELAERIRTLQRKSPGSMAEFLQLTTLKEGKTTLGQKEMILELMEDHDRLEENLHTTIQYMDSVLDQGTSDLLIERIRFHAKAAWLLRSHYQ